MIGAHRRVALRHFHLGAVVVACPVEPGRIQLAGDLNHQGVAFPAAVGPAHPGIDRRWPRVFHVDVTHRAGVLVGNEDGIGALKNLQRLRHVGGPRHARQVALHLRIPIDPVGLVLLLLGQGLRLVGYLAAFNHAHARRHRPYRAKVERFRRRQRSMRPFALLQGGAGHVQLDVVVGFIERLPDTVQVWMNAIRSPRRPPGVADRHGCILRRGAGRQRHKQGKRGSKRAHGERLRLLRWGARTPPHANA